MANFTPPEYDDDNPPPPARLRWVCPQCDHPLLEERGSNGPDLDYDLRCETDGLTFRFAGMIIADYVPSGES